MARGLDGRCGRSEKVRELIGEAEALRGRRGELEAAHEALGSGADATGREALDARVRQDLDDAARAAQLDVEGMLDETGEDEREILDRLSDVAQGIAAIEERVLDGAGERLGEARVEQAVAVRGDVDGVELPEDLARYLHERGDAGWERQTLAATERRAGDDLARQLDGAAERYEGDSDILNGVLSGIVAAQLMAQKLSSEHRQGRG